MKPGVKRDQFIVESVASGISVGQLASALKISRQMVCQIYHRIMGDSINIRKKRMEKAWPPDRLKALGKFSDRHLANAWGISYGRVQAKRTSLGIPAYRIEAPRHSRVGEIYNSLKIIKYVHVPGIGFKYICVCRRCGKTTKPLALGNIKRTKTCGCLRRDYYLRNEIRRQAV